MLTIYLATIETNVSLPKYIHHHTQLGREEGYAYAMSCYVTIESYISFGVGNKGLPLGKDSVLYMRKIPKPAKPKYFRFL